MLTFIDARSCLKCPSVENSESDVKRCIKEHSGQYHSTVTWLWFAASLWVPYRARAAQVCTEHQCVWWSDDEVWMEVEIGRRIGGRVAWWERANPRLHKVPGYHTLQHIRVSSNNQQLHFSWKIASFGEWDCVVTELIGWKQWVSTWTGTEATSVDTVK